MTPKTIYWFCFLNISLTSEFIFIPQITICKLTITFDDFAIIPYYYYPTTRSVYILASTVDTLSCHWQLDESDREPTSFTIFPRKFDIFQETLSLSRSSIQASLMPMFRPLPFLFLLSIALFLLESSGSYAASASSIINPAKVKQISWKPRSLSLIPPFGCRENTHWILSLLSHLVVSKIMISSPHLSQMDEFAEIQYLVNLVFSYRNILYSDLILRNGFDDFAELLSTKVSLRT